jgi:hypothetical protein
MIVEYVKGNLKKYQKHQEKIRKEWMHRDPVVCKGKLA